MAKKQLYLPEAERLYVTEQCTLAEIASRLTVNEKTVRSWKDQGDWENKRLQYLKGKQAFHEDLYSFARTLLKSIRSDLESGNQVDTGRLYAFTRILPLILKVKDYEDVVKKKEGADRSVTTQELVELIEKDVLKIQ